MDKLVIGILAPVDAGKTTLSESLLYICGKIQKLGRVDNQDAYLDTHNLEKERGITIFSKQAVFVVGDTQITLLDTPGHVDFSADMERTLQVLDCAILVISVADGVQGHTKTLWHLLALYNIPVFIFVNKMDQDVTDQDTFIQELKKQLGDGCNDFGQGETECFYEQLAMCDETMLDAYLVMQHLELWQIKRAIVERKVFPCYFGSALKVDGVNEFVRGIVKYASIPLYRDEFGARIFKISRDEQGNRLTHMKVTGGRLRVKEVLTNGVWAEKVNQIRIYSGQKFELANAIEAGAVCAVTGLTQARPGEVLGIEVGSQTPVLEPVLSYQVTLPEGLDPREVLPKLRQLEEEEPELHIAWDEQLQEIRAQIMGEVQIEILQSLIRSRFNVDVQFNAGRILYKETTENVVEGVGHFEPLGHYAEVHLLLEPGKPGSGLTFAVDCSEDLLGRSWQKLILSHLKEKTHKGVLTGSEITDLKITLISGRAHNKHTAGGDFREATYRAVRQGLKEAKSVLLEPYYRFQLEVPDNFVGKAMTDIEKMHGFFEISTINPEGTVLVGSAPVVTMRNYHRDVVAYTRGRGRLFCQLQGYKPCHNSQEVIAAIGYDSERDVENPTGSVFCVNGSGFFVRWNQIKDYMHVEGHFRKEVDLAPRAFGNQGSLSTKKLDNDHRIDHYLLERAVNANKGKKSGWKKRSVVKDTDNKAVKDASEQPESKEAYLLVDGYNIIHAWPALKDLVDKDMDAARNKLLDRLRSYQGIRQCQIIVVFDAYLVQGHREEVLNYHNIHVVFTKEAQTADQYIERFAYDTKGKYAITVATSDGLQQTIIRGAGCALLSARQLLEEIEDAHGSIQQARPSTDGNYLGDTLTLEVRQQIDKLHKKKEDER